MAELRDARPPARLVTALNVANRRVLRSPFGRAVPVLALLEFQGRRSGRRYRVPVGWHRVHGTAVVVTPARWRANFATGLPVTVHHRGLAMRCIGTLDRDHRAVAAAINDLISAGTGPRRLGLVVPPGHTVSELDAAAVDRALVRLRPA